ncbi:MAG: selenocysteine-specific translation elongation factor [Candidatus Aminicenantes bacterium]|nr:selenocysteine-specific translation elongation factor [Candidatus Aminicenantes bacterium]
MSEKEHVIVGTAGHIDHGKSSLVKALTGTDPDTLPEEKERGLTIELGFVFMDVPDYEKQIVFIDVPGHEKFVKTMVAGASSIDVVLFIIAADEGISVQTREHFDILQLLRVKEGIIALTKSDLVDADQIEKLNGEVSAFVHGTFLEGAPILPVSSVTGSGLAEIKAALMAAGRRVRRREDCGYFRLPVDRVFVMHGFGTVIAGTVLSGGIKTGDRIEILPERIETKVRGVQVHKEKRDASGLGKRTALNLHDIDKTLLRRGQCAVAPGLIAPASRLDTRLHLLKQAPKGLKTRDRVRLHIGTDEVIARVILLEKDKLLPGESMLAQFVLESPTAAFYKDRFIIRTFSPLNTIGGGDVLDIAPPRHKRFDAAALAGIRRFEGAPEDAAEQFFRKTSDKSRTAEEVSFGLWAGLKTVENTIQKLVDSGRLKKMAADKDKRYVVADAWPPLLQKALAAVKKYFAANPHRPFMPLADLHSSMSGAADEPMFKTVVDELAASGAVVRKEGGLTLPGFEARLESKDQEFADRVEAIFRKAGYEPPLGEDVCRELRLPLNQFRKVLGTLLQQGKLIRLDPKVIYHRAAFEKARESVMEYLQKKRSITIAETKDILRVSRKYACAVLEYLDKTQITRRNGDVHVIK